VTHAEVEKLITAVPRAQPRHELAIGPLTRRRRALANGRHLEHQGRFLGAKNFTRSRQGGDRGGVFSLMGMVTDVEANAAVGKSRAPPTREEGREGLRVLQVGREPLSSVPPSAEKKPAA